MQKDFDRWNKVKKAVNATDEDERVYFHEGDIWWVHLGVNVGFEIDAKQRDFSRPVIICQRRREIASASRSKNPSARQSRRPPISGAFLISQLNPEGELRV